MTGILEALFFFGGFGALSLLFLWAALHLIHRYDF